MIDKKTVTSLLDKQELELAKLHTALINELDVLKSKELSTLEATSAEKENILTVKNNVIKKKYMPRETESSGLNNIQSRYAFFSEKNIEIIETEGMFEVRLPLIEIEYA